MPADEAAPVEPPRTGFWKFLPPKSELKKILPLGLIFFFVLFSYTILRDTKDVLVVTAPKAGAEIIPFLKVRRAQRAARRGEAARGAARPRAAHATRRPRAPSTYAPLNARRASLPALARAAVGRRRRT
jgi:hypothetical protein